MKKKRFRLTGSNSTKAEFEILAYAPVRNHFRIAFRNHKYNNSGVWYIHETNIEISENNQVVYPKVKPENLRIKVPYKPKLDDLYNPTGLCNITSIASCLEFLEAHRRSNYGEFEDELYEYALSQGYSRHNPYHLVKIVKEYIVHINEFITIVIANAII